MVPAWTDTRSFQKHLETMKKFRESHYPRPVKELRLKDTASQGQPDLLQRENGIDGLINLKRKTALVLIWELETPPGSQN
jgi:hypothetical protein